MSSSYSWKRLSFFLVALKSLRVLCKQRLLQSNQLSPKCEVLRVADVERKNDQLPMYNIESSSAYECNCCDAT
jgi:hypothetical protein